MTTIKHTLIAPRYLCVLLLGFTIPGYGQNLSVSLVDQAGDALGNAVVEVVLPADIALRFAEVTDTEIDQLDKEFVPTVTTVVAGSKVHFPNSDDILHHVYSFSPINAFDIPLYGNDIDARFVEEFPQPGVLELGCNIHDWMLAYIYVAESSKVAVSDEAGQALIEALPSGTYPVRVWHARLPRTTTYHMVNVTIEEGSTAELQVTLELERDRRIRRAPSANTKRYR